MEDYQNRVIKEYDELKDKIVKLRAFISGTAYYQLGFNQKQLLQRQLKIMIRYATILDERIKFF